MKRYAVCLFGEPRTGKYCAPWQKEAYRFADGVTDFFCDYKTTSNEVNTVQKNLVSHSSIDISEIVSALSVAKFTITPTSLDSHVQIGKPHYARMMSSIARVVWLKQRYEYENNFQYDAVFVSRHDVLPGPDINTLREIRANEPQHLSLHVSHTSNIRFFEAHRAGFPDLLFYGSSFTIDALAANTYRYWAANNNYLKAYYTYGPNVFLSLVASDAGLSVTHSPFETAIVRMSDNLNYDIFAPRTWSYHKEFEVESAVWNPKNK